MRKSTRLSPGFKWKYCGVLLLAGAAWGQEVAMPSVDMASGEEVVSSLPSDVPLAQLSVPEKAVVAPSTLEGVLEFFGKLEARHAAVHAAMLAAAELGEAEKSNLGPEATEIPYSPMTTPARLGAGDAIGTAGVAAVLYLFSPSGLKKALEEAKQP
jgi:hypothetical protein